MTARRPDSNSQRTTLLVGLMVITQAGFVVSGFWLMQGFINRPEPTLALVQALPTLTYTPSATATPTPSFTPSATHTPTVTRTATQTATPTNSSTATITPSVTETPSQTPTATFRPTVTPRSTLTPLWPVGRLATPFPTVGSGSAATLEDFWDGRAEWKLETADVGLPIGESDTLLGPDGQVWSYLHSSYPTLGIRDQYDAPVDFPGCVTLWKSPNRGRNFRLFSSRCLIQCRGTPCTLAADHIDQQQYPRVMQHAASGYYVMAYEYRAATFLRTSADGYNWSAPAIVPGTGQWKGAPPCRPEMAIGAHPFIDSADEYTCLAGGPPGLYIEGDELYVFVALGKSPGRLGCFRGPVQLGAAGLRPCLTSWLFAGVPTYGPVEITGAAANPYFDFRILSSADVIKAGDHYYMAYEGIRGPHRFGVGDTQFNLGFARSAPGVIDGPWEKYPGNPVLGDVPGNYGLGHADLLVLDGVTYLYTATSDRTRGRYVLEWK
jgi:hypothetical protein